LGKFESLKRKREFDAVFQRGRRSGGRALGVLTLAGEPGAGVRYGLIVSRRNAGNAVRRNLIRRRLREALRTLVKDCAIDLDVVFVARSGVRELSYQDMAATIARALPRQLRTPASLAECGGDAHGAKEGSVA